MQLAHQQIEPSEAAGPSGASAALGARVRIAPAFAVSCAIFAAAQQACFWLSPGAAASGVLMRESDTLFGWDVPRAVRDMTIPGENFRSNVHPLFVLFAKPLAWVFRGPLGMEPFNASVWVCSVVAGVAAVLMLRLLLAWGARLPEAALFAALFASSSMPLFGGAIPETGIFSICSVVLFLLLASRALNGLRVPLPVWLLGGVAGYGVTISNTPKLLAAFAAAQSEGRSLFKTLARAALFGAVVVAAGAGLTRAVGSSFAVANDTFFLSPAFRGGTIPNAAGRAAMNFVFYDVVAPAPSRQIVTYFTRRDFAVVTFNESRYAGGRAALAAVWGGLLVLAAGLAAFRPRPGERAALALFALCVALDIACFSNYYVRFEGQFLYSAQAVAAAFAPMAFLAARISALRPAARWGAFAAIALFGAALAASNAAALIEALRLASEPARFAG